MYRRRNRQYTTIWPVPPPHFLFRMLAIQQSALHHETDELELSLGSFSGCHAKITVSGEELRACYGAQGGAGKMAWPYSPFLARFRTLPQPSSYLSPLN